MASQGTVVSGLAARYAAALFDLADEQKALDQTAQDLTSLKQILAESADLRRVVRSPVLSRAEQARAMEAVLSQAGASELVRKFIGLVAQNRRLFALDGMIVAFLAELAQRRGEETATVISARPLTEEQLSAVTDALKKALGSKVSVAASVDPTLLGGMIVKVGSRMIDSSVRTKLTKLKIAMKGVG
ncbi:F0F1 ATP synthase subunit delta [Nitrospirillum sp. BR 11163]|uniref:F0F1 ATP synthase subunit delta n=1 Tax=Nitrospirillum sp. BR 11163 TaxID=3104323 RepID=UPI002AFFDDF4|nr:F0F1 ATP synthase subunit delta [Nitrospirillum sp. BR 11163]MEA1677111.1 F0F1 ATP synthase subunit delta [Nitrospirillum sp. BR 11163]